jgi:hypothetical protein
LFGRRPRDAGHYGADGGRAPSRRFQLLGCRIAGSLRDARCLCQGPLSQFGDAIAGFAYKFGGTLNDARNHILITSRFLLCHVSSPQNVYLLRKKYNGRGVESVSQFCLKLALSR